MANRHQGLGAGLASDLALAMKVLVEASGGWAASAWPNFWLTRLIAVWDGASLAQAFESPATAA